MNKAIASFIVIAAAALVTGTVAAFAAPPNPSDFTSTIDNPLFPLSSLGPKLFEGEATDPDTGEVVETRLESRVLPQKETVAGVEVLVLEEKAFEDGELVEVALDFFAQHRDGSVYYFGERVDNYEGGVVINHDGQWLSGEGENEPGIIMQAHPVVGQTYDQEHAPGIAEDKGTVISINESVRVPAGAFNGCLKTKDFSPLEPGIEEFKFYCLGVGVVREEGANEFLDLVSIGPAPTPVPAPTLTARPATVPAPTQAPVLRPATTGTGTPAEKDGLPPYAVVLAAIGLTLVGLGAAGMMRKRMTRG